MRYSPIDVYMPVGLPTSNPTLSATSERILLHLQSLNCFSIQGLFVTLLLFPTKLRFAGAQFIGGIIYAGVPVRTHN